MNRVVGKTRVRVFPQIGLCLVLVTVSGLVAAALPQRAALDQNVLAPPKSKLVPVHWPDLTRLEAEVCDQLAAAQNALAAAARDPRTPDAELSEAYGALGQIYQAYSLNSAARECYLNASTLTPRDFRWVYLLGKLDQQQDLFEEAAHQSTVRWWPWPSRNSGAAPKQPPGSGG